MKTLFEIEDKKLIKYNGDEETVHIPAGIEEVGRYSFAENKKIKKVVIGNDVKRISTGAFRNCTGLEYVNLIEVAAVNSYAFAGCTSLNQVEFKNCSFKTIGPCVFKGCISLREFKVPENIKRIGKGAFCKCYSLKRVISSTELSQIKAFAFSKCRALKTVELTSKETSIDIKAFYQCNKSLEFIWNSKDSYPKEASKGFDINHEGILRRYYGIDKYVIIPETVKEIGDYAFSGGEIEGISSKFPVKTIGRGAFAFCNKLRSVYLDDIKSIEDCAFWRAGLTEPIFLPTNLEYVGKDAFGACSRLKKIVFLGENVRFAGRIAPMSYNLERVELPKKLKIIPQSAFYFCESLNKCDLPETVESIGESAFIGCKSLEKINIPQKVKSIDWNVFNFCSGLKEVVLMSKDTEMTGRTDEFCTASFRYFDQPKVKKAVIFIGIQGSGKTYYYNWHFAGKYEHINLDELHTRNNEMKALEEFITKGADIVIDNTNITRADRQRYIPILKAAGYEISGYIFESKVKDCIRRNELRTGKARVPAAAIAATSNKMQLPTRDEGFDELYYVEHSGETVMLKRDWREENEI